MRSLLRRKAQVVALSERRLGGGSGSTLPRDEREARVFEEVLAGNVPSWLWTSSLAELRSGDGASVVPFQVTLDSLVIGFDGDYFLMPPSLPGPRVSHRLRRSRFPCMLARSRAIARHPRARHAPHNPVSTSC